MRLVRVTLVGLVGFAGFAALGGLGACSGVPATTEQPAAPAPTPKRRAAIEREPVDAMAQLVDDAAPIAWIVPGKIQLELGAAAIEPPGGDRPLRVVYIDRAGADVRIGVVLEHARFAVWIHEKFLLGVVTRAQTVRVSGAARGSSLVTLGPGAPVVVKQRAGSRSTIRYFGALAVEGSIDAAAIADHVVASNSRGRVPTGNKQMLVTPGTAIRGEPRWQSAQLAVVVESVTLDVHAELDQGYYEVGYVDGDIEVRGFASRREPPVKTFHARSVPVPAVPANEKVASGTCLFSAFGGEAIGYIDGARDVLLEPTTDNTDAGWWYLTIDSPWGPLAFAARGPSLTELETCGP